MKSYLLKFAAPLGLIAAAMLAIVLFGSSSSGCAGGVGEAIRERPVLARLAVTAATLKVIGDDHARAARAASVAGAIRAAASGGTAATVEELERVARAQIDWSQLDETNTLLVELLIAEVRSELLQRLPAGGVIPAESRADVATIFGWIESTAALRAASQPAPPAA